MIPGHHPPDGVAVTMEPSGATMTFGELDAAANRVSRLFRAEGLKPGDHVAFCVENSITFFVLAWGSIYAGLLYTACPTGLTADELTYIVDDSEAQVFVISARYGDRAAAIRAATPGVRRYVALGGAIDGYEDYETLVAAHEPVALDEERVGGRDMLYSSGTTGRPKGVRTGRPTLPLEEGTGVVSPILEQLLGTGADDVYLSPAPLYHAAPLRFCLSHHRLGGHVVAMERWDPAAALALIERHRVTLTQFVPTMFIRMLQLPDEVRAAADVSSLRGVIHGAAPCPASVKRQMIEWWGPIIHEYYAATEGGGLTWVTSQEWLERPGTVGRPLIGEPHIVGPDGEELGPGQDGAIYFSGGAAFAYHGDPEKTASITDSRGWQTLGDIGHVDADGYLYLTDRASYMIISGGVNIYPQEAENTLQSHPAVLDAAVFGIPHEVMGEQVKAVVQPVTMPDSPAAAELLEEQLIAHCREHMSAVKCPRSIDFRPELPRTPTGKLVKRLLKDEYAANV